MARRLLNGLALVKWGRGGGGGGGPLHGARTSRTRQKSIFSLPYTETEPLAERHANTEVFLFFLSFLFFLRTPCRGQPHRAFHLQRWLMRPQLLQHAGMLRDTHAARTVSSSNTSATANSQARHSHVNECGSKSQSRGRAFKQQWLRVYFFFLDTHCGSNVCVGNTSQVLSNSNIPALFSSDNATIYSRILWDKRCWLFIANGHFFL